MKFIYSVIVIFILVSSLSKLNAFENEYDVRNIPFQLLPGANVVIRKDEIRFVVEDYRNANYKVKYAVTIFSKEGQHYGRLSLLYDKFRSIDDLDGVIFDSKGEEVRDLESSDIKDYSDYANYSVYNDNRVKFVELYYDKFPYTVEFTYEITLEGYLSWPKWYSRHSLEPVELTRFEVITPGDYELRFWTNIENVKPGIKNINDEKIYLWEEKKLLKLPLDVYGEDIEDVATIVYIAPSDFEIDGYKGNMDSWETFGKWYFKLCKDKNILPADALSNLKNSLDSSSGVKDKIEILYNYLQTRTRYVSIQLGIGSWQPFDAAYVHKNGYGDCKALSNYMVSILNLAGITAYPVLINNGDYHTPLIFEFPSNQFNHVLVCVPLETDTIWLECTSQVLPPGNIGWSNENRYALMVTPEGGKIIKTPVSCSERNLQLKNLSVNLSSTGRADVNAGIKWFGDQLDYVVSNLEKSTPKEKDVWIKNLLEVPDVKLNGFEFDFNNKKHNGVGLQMNIILNKYGSVLGSRIFFNPNLIERRTSAPKVIAERLSPVRFKYPYTDIDSVYYRIPEDYKVEALPKEVNIQSTFGKFYSRTTDNGDNTIIYIRSLEINKYMVPAENYNEYQKFFADVVNADKQQVVLVKTEE